MQSELRRILRKCLEKDRARRYQSMHDVAIDLDNLARETASASAPARTSWGAMSWVRSMTAACGAIERMTDFTTPTNSSTSP